MGRNGTARTEEHSMVPPHDLDAERSVIGALLVSETAVSVVGGMLVAEDFYSETHRVIYEAVMRISSRHVPVDQLTLADELKSMGEYDRVGGRAYVFQIVESVPTAANAARYAEIVRNKANLRRMIDAASRMAQTAYQEPQDVPGALDGAEQLLYAISDRAADPSELSPLAEIAPEALEEAQRLYEAGGTITGTPLGFQDLDELTGGVHNGDLVLVAGRPAMGKTGLGLGAVWYAATSGTPAAVFSLEMDKKQLVQRLLSQESGVSVTNIRRGRIADREWPAFVRASAKLGQTPLYIDDTAMITVAEMRAKLRRLSSRLRGRGQRLGLVVVDYLQLMVPGMRADNRQAEVAEISRALKVLARDLHVPVVALAQLSRECEKRHNKRPMLSDLRDSGALEQDADMVMFLYRDEYYNEDSDDRGIGEVIVGKHRNGPTGTVKLVWLEKEARFAPLRRAY